MQLHPLLFRTILSGGGCFRLGDGEGGQLQVAVVQPQLALHRHVHPLLDALQDGFRRPVLHEFGDGDRVCVVRHVETDDPRVALFQLPVVDAEHLAGDGDPTEIQAHLAHGDGLGADGLAQDHPHHRFQLPLFLHGHGGTVGHGLLHGRLAQGFGLGEDVFRCVRDGRCVHCFRRFRRQFFPAGFLRERLFRRLFRQRDVVADGGVQDGFRRRWGRCGNRFWNRLRSGLRRRLGLVQGGVLQAVGQADALLNGGDLVGRGGIGKGHLQVHRPAGLVDGGIPYGTALRRLQRRPVQCALGEHLEQRNALFVSHSTLLRSITRYQLTRTIRLLTGLPALFSALFRGKRASRSRCPRRCPHPPRTLPRGR